MPDPFTILRKHEDDITSLEFLSIDETEKTSILASGDVTGHVKLWNLDTRRPTIEFKPNSDKSCAITHIDFHQNSNNLITCVHYTVCYIIV